MKVMFYEINDCEYEYLNGRPAITAPYCTDFALLKKYHFVQLIDGRWVHYMTDREIDNMRKYPNGEPLIIYDDAEERYIMPENQQPERDSENDAIVTIGLTLLFLLGFCMTTVNSNIGSSAMFVSFISLLACALGLKNKSAGVVVIIILVGLQLVSVILLMAAINSCLYECSTIG